MSNPKAQVVSIATTNVDQFIDDICRRSKELEKEIYLLD